MTTTGMNQDAQMSFDEETIDDSELERQMGEWYDLNEVAKAESKKANVKKDAIKNKLEEKELRPGRYRLGEYVVTVTETKSRHVEFDVPSKRQIRLPMSRK